MRKVVHPGAAIAGPFAVQLRLLTHVDWRKRQLVHPAGDQPLLIDVAGGLARAHGDAQDRMIFELECASQRRHVTIIGDLQRYAAPFLRDILVNALDARLEGRFRHLAE